MIDAKKVDLTIKEYFIEAFKHMWGHQVLFIFTTILFMLVGSSINLLPRFMGDVFGFFVGSYFFFLLMEITFSSTQEKYNPKKYIASFYVAFIHLLNFTKKHKGMIMVFLGIMVTFSIFYHGLKSYSVVEENDIWFSWMFFIFLKPIPNFFLVLFFISHNKHYSVGDEFILSRMVGLGETDDELLKKAFILNVDIFNKIGAALFIFGVMFSVFFILAVPIVVFLAVVATLYGMDVFDVDRFKKVRQQQEEKEKRELPIPQTS